MENWHYCGLHAFVRVTEKLLSCMYRPIYDAQVKARAAKDKKALADADKKSEALLHLLNVKLKVNGGFCTFEPKLSKSGAATLRRIPLNGRDARLVVENYRDIIKAGLLDTDPLQLQRWVQAWSLWQVLMPALDDTVFMTPTVARQAQAVGFIALMPTYLA
jgi:hypothetical protein